MGDAWQKWWEEAKANDAAADALFAAGLHSLAIFHSVMAMETAGKAMRLMGLTQEEMGQFTHEELAAYPHGELGGQPIRGHDLKGILQAPWLVGTERAVVLDRLDQVSAKFGDRKIYEACRYPDVWGDADPAPSKLFTADDALALRGATGFVLFRCKERLRKREAATP